MNADRLIVGWFTAPAGLFHPTVANFLSYYEGVVAIPIGDLSASETALVWLTAGESPKVDAFARAAADALAQTELAPYQPCV